MASPNFSTILKNLSPVLLVYDVLPHWASSLALSQNIPAVEFLSTSATAASFAVHLIRNPGVQFPFPETCLRDYEFRRFMNLLQSSGNDRAQLECLEQSCEIVLIITFKEIEAKYIEYLSILMGKKIVPVGPLVEDPVHEHEKTGMIMEWF